MSMNINPSDMAALQALFSAAGQYNWSDLLGQVTLGTPTAGTPILSSLEATGNAYGPGGTMDPTLQALQLIAQSGGVLGNIPGLPAGLANTPTLPAKEATGFINGVPTTQEQQIQNQQQQFLANLVMNATKSPADAFSYAAKLQGLQHAGVLGQLLGSNMAFAAGQPLSQLQQNPNLSNTQLATDMASGMQGGPVSSATQNFLQRLLGVPASPAQTGGTATPPLPSAPQAPAATSPYGTLPTALAGSQAGIQSLLSQYGANGLVNQVTGEVPGNTVPNANVWNQGIGQLRNYLNGAPDAATALAQIKAWLGASAPLATPGATANGSALPAGGSVNTAIRPIQANMPVTGSGLGPNQANPLLSPNSGFQTSLQAYNRLDPTQQAMYQDLVSNSSGQMSTDFLKQLAQGGPQFQTSGIGKISNVEGL